MPFAKLRPVCWLLPALLVAGCTNANDSSSASASRSAPSASVPTDTSTKAPIDKAPKDGVFYAVSFDKALSLSKEQGKPVMVDFYADWCGPCKLLDSTTWKDPEVIRWLDSKVIAIKIDVDKHPDLAKRFRIESIPALVFIKADGKEMGRVEGYRKPGEFQEAAQEVLSSATGG